MFRSPFYVTVIETDDGFFRPAMMSRRELDPGEGLIWSTGDSYSVFDDAEQVARQWASQEGPGYEFVPAGKVPA